MEDLLQNTYSLSSLHKRLRVLKSYLSQKFFGGTKQTLTSEEAAWLNSLPKEFLEKFNENNLSQTISELENAINKLETLTLYLPFEIEGEAVNQLGSKTRQTFQKLLLLDIKYDPKLIAGCALVWKGVYKDYSLRAKIEQRKTEVLESFKKFLR